MDFQDDRRDQVIRFVVDKYGRDHVAQIITFGTMGPRAAIRDVGRALGMAYGGRRPRGPGSSTLGRARCRKPSA